MHGPPSHPFAGFALLNAARLTPAKGADAPICVQKNTRNAGERSISNRAHNIGSPGG